MRDSLSSAGKRSADRLIDCHTHLTSACFDADRTAVLERAATAGLGLIAVVGEDDADHQRVLTLCEQHNTSQHAQRNTSQHAQHDAREAQVLPRLLPFLGLHPDRFADNAAPQPNEDRPNDVPLSGVSLSVRAGERNADRLIDCHTHLTSACFDADRTAVLERAATAGLGLIAVVGEDAADHQRVLTLCEQHNTSQHAQHDAHGEQVLPRLLPFLGLHPDHFADNAAPQPNEDRPNDASASGVSRSDSAGERIADRLIDCHTHLTSACFDADRTAVLERAAAAGLSLIAVVGEDIADNQRVLALCEQHNTSQHAQHDAHGEQALPRLLPFLGLHPDRFADNAAPQPNKDRPNNASASGDTSLSDAPLNGVPLSDAAIADWLLQVEKHASTLAGIGEVGLDYWRAKQETSRARQREVLAAIIALARAQNLPLNVHSRSAGHHTLRFLEQHGARRVLMHAFDGKAGHAREAAQAGFLFSIPPSILRSPQKQKLVRLLPLEALALETDSPVLGPEKTQRNEPANVRYSLQSIARIKQIEASEVRRQTTQNALRWLDGKHRPLRDHPGDPL